MGRLANTHRAHYSFCLGGREVSLRFVKVAWVRRWAHRMETRRVMVHLQNRKPVNSFVGPVTDLVAPKSGAMPMRAILHSTVFNRTLETVRSAPVNRGPWRLLLSSSSTERLCRTSCWTNYRRRL